MGVINQYMMMHYESRMKEEAERRITIAQRKFDRTTKEERIRDGLKKPMAIVIRKETANKFWLTETDTIKEEVHARIEADYNEELEAWAAKLEVPKTAQEYHQ
jgi:hypothetical protein